MQDPRLVKRAVDDEFQRRAGRLWRPYVLAILPPLIVAGTTWFEYGVLSWAGASAASLLYALSTIRYAFVVRRVTISGLRREGQASPDYRPPWFW